MQIKGMEINKRPQSAVHMYQVFQRNVINALYRHVNMCIWRSSRGAGKGPWGKEEEVKKKDGRNVIYMFQLTVTHVAIKQYKNMLIKILKVSLYLGSKEAKNSWNKGNKPINSVS